MSKYQGKFSRGGEAPVRRVQKKKKSKAFLVFMILWCLVFLGATAYGLKTLWDYLAVYEVSLPEYAMDGYMQQLNKEDFYDKSPALTERIDFRLESEEDCRALVLDALEGELVYVQRPKESNETQQVYAILCGKKTVGTVTLARQPELEFGLKPWAVAEEHYDLSYLMGTETVGVTAPRDYTVKVNGVVLDASYIVQEDVHFESMEELYEDYQVPTMVVYQAGPFLGEGKLELLDRQGNPAQEDMAAYLNNCTEEEIQELDSFLEDFVNSYVTFSGSNKNTRHKNLTAVLKYVLEDTDLEKRLRSAVEGLQFGQSRGATVQSLTRNQCTSVGEGRYFVDITYEVDTVGREEVIHTTTNAQLILLKTNKGLKVEILMNY